jgi:hypothetical protein
MSAKLPGLFLFSTRRGFRAFINVDKCGEEVPSLRGDPSLTLRMTEGQALAVILNEGCRSEGK